MKKKITVINSNVKLSWDFLLEYKDFFNQLFSTYYPFTESQLIKFHKKLSLGSSFYKVKFYTIFGLIYNNEITWTGELKNIYHEESILLYVDESNDVYSTEVDFSELPMDLVKELNIFRSTSQSDVIAGYEYSEEEGYYDSLNEELKDWDEYYDNILCKGIFSIDELINIVKTNDYKFIANKNVYSQLMREINANISDFSVELYYQKS